MRFPSLRRLPLLFGTTICLSASPTFGQERQAPPTDPPGERSSTSTAAGPISQRAYFKASNADAKDLFGASVAVSGDTAIVGAQDEDSVATGVNGNQDDETAPGAGAAYVFLHDGSAWSQQAYLKASNTEASDGFGFSVDIDGDTIVVGAPFEGSSSTGVNGEQEPVVSAALSGAAYVFVRNGTTWSQEAYLKASNTEAFDGFGFRVAISGDTIVVGALFEDSGSPGVNGDQADNSATDAGAAYVFLRSGTQWSQQAYLKASNPDAGDLFGTSVAHARERIAVGASGEDSAATGVNGNQDDESAPNAGAAYVYRRTGTSWSQLSYLKASNTESEDRFGETVAVAGPRVAVGAPNEGSDLAGVNGGAPNELAPGSGAVYVFRFDPEGFVQEAFVKATAPDPWDGFGFAVTLDSNSLIVGAPYEDSASRVVNGDESNNDAEDAGAAYLYSRNVTLWAPSAYLKAANADAQDNFGYATAGMDGSHAILGAWTEDGAGRGVNVEPGTNGAGESGAAYVFDVPQTAQVTRNAGNPWSLFVTDPVIGLPWSVTVFLTRTGHDQAQVRGFSDPITQLLPGRQLLLVGGQQLFVLPFRPGPAANWSVTIPNDPTLAGRDVYIQAIHAFGLVPFALSNAVDLRLGY